MEHTENRKKLFVASISFRARDNDLYTLFSSIGTVIDAKVIVGRDGRSKGYGFVEMSTEEEAQHAIAQLNGFIHFDRKIVVNPQLPKSRQQPINHPSAMAMQDTIN